MGKFVRTLLGFLLLGCYPMEAAEFWNPMFNAEITTGYRQDNFSWNMSGLHDTPDQLWTMYWKGLQIYEVATKLSYTSCNNYYIRGNGNWGGIYCGSVTARGLGQDVTGTSITSSSTTSSDSRSHHDNFSRIHGDGDNGSVWDGGGAVGYQWMSNGRRFVITPVIGYAFHALNLEMHNARQVVNTIDFPLLLGRIPDLNVRYRPRIQGPFVGFDFITIVEMPCVLLFGTFEFEWDRYRAQGKWNFQDQFIQSWRDSTRGKGMYVNLGFNYRMGCNWYLGIIGTYRNWHGREGRHVPISLTNTLAEPDQIFGTMPAFPPREHLHCKRIQWSSWSVVATLDFRFWD